MNEAKEARREYERCVAAVQKATGEEHKRLMAEKLILSAKMRAAIAKEALEAAEAAKRPKPTPRRVFASRPVRSVEPTPPTE